MIEILFIYSNDFLIISIKLLLVNILKSSYQNFYNFIRKHSNKMNPSSNRYKNILQNRQQLIHLIQILINDILQQTRSIQRGSSKFHCRQPPAISIGEYLKRISKYAHCSNSVYVLALIYIDRFQQLVNDFFLNKYCIHRMLICSIMVAAKYLDDFYYKNDYYAKVGGILKNDINILEIQFVQSLHFNTYVSEHQFDIYLEKLYSFKEVNELVKSH